jgi:hypothetical protein
MICICIKDDEIVKGLTRKRSDSHEATKSQRERLFTMNGIFFVIFVPPCEKFIFYQIIKDDIILF